MHTYTVHHLFLFVFKVLVFTYILDFIYVALSQTLSVNQ